MDGKKSIGIYPRKGSFSDRWITYCEDKHIPYFLIDPFKNDFFENVKGLSAFLWHWPHSDPIYLIMAKHITFALEKLGIIVFPNHDTCWHFDDKIAQKYLFESINAPFPKTWIFYDKKEAMEWVRSAEYPIVFKLPSGASSYNVRLV
ncbi:MAG: hypothetical protein H5U39_05470, partial [Deferribacterales bacterium]|nr:hypothetical protein [Deferribacterales bacterium]